MLITVPLGLLLVSPIIINNIDINQFKPYIEARVLDRTGRQLRINGDLKLNLSLHPSLKVKKISFANAVWSKQQPMIVAEEIQLKIDLMSLLDKQVVIEELILKGVVLVVEKNSEGQASWVFENFDLAVEKSPDEMEDSDSLVLPFVPVLKHVQFNDVSVQYSDVNSKIKTKVNVKSLRLSNHAMNEPFTFNVDGLVNDYPFEVVGEAALQDGVGSSGETRPLIIKVDINAIGVALSLNGEIGQPIIDGSVNVDVSLAIKDVSNTFTAVTGQSLSLYSVNTNQVLPLHLSANISNKKNIYNLSAIKLKLADSDLSGSVSLINTPARPQVKANLRSKVIYLDRFWVKTKEVSGENVKASIKQSPFVIPEIPIELDWLKMVDGEFSYSAKKVHADNLLVEDVSFNAQLDNGRLKVKQLDFNVDGASVRGHLSVDSRRKVPLVNVVAAITKVDLASFAKYVSFSSPQRGGLSAEINLEGRGANTKNLLFSLGGKSKLHLSKLLIKQDVANKTRDIYIEELALNFVEMDKPMAFSLSGMMDKEEVLVSGELMTVLSILNNKSTHLTSKAMLLDTEFSIDANSDRPMFLNSVQTDVSVIIPNPAKSFHRLVQLFPGISIDGDVPALPTNVRTYLKLSKGSVDAKNINITMGENDLSGNVFIDTNKKKLFIKADIRSELIDLDALYPLSKGKKVEQENVSAGDKLFSTEPFPSLDGLDYLNADIHYQLKKLTRNNQSINNVLMNLTVNEGRLNLKPLTMNFAKGIIKTNLELVEDNGLNFQADVKINNLDYEKLMTLIGIKEYAKGNFDADVNLQGVGNSVSELMAGLNGQVRLTSEGGSLNMDAMQLLSKDLVSLIPFTDRGDRQKIRCAVMQFNIDDGIAQSHALVLDTGIVSALGAGEVNLATESLSLYVAPRTKRTSVLKLALVPLNIRGSFLSPTIAPDVAGTTVSTTNKAVHIGLAVATGGITLLTEDLTNKLWEQFVDDADYCALALAGKKVIPTLVKLKADGDEFNQSEKDANYIEELDGDDGGL